MKIQKYTVGLAFLMVLGLSLAVLVPAQAVRNSSPKSKPAQAGNYKFSGPFVHKNLTVYLIHGKDMIKNKTILTLQEAMERKVVIVHETKSVNELAIENVSKTLDVFVQSGDIVKGGQQDRVLAVDLIVPARSGRISISAFCVESGRWSKRGDEEAGKFTGSSDRIATKELKLAANSSKSQSEVWEKVAEAQDKLSQNVGGSVNSAQSSSSLQLSLENKKVRETSDEYINKLSQIVDRESDVIGYAFAINGKVNSADVYASNSLFKKLWPKLLKATAIEAVAEMTTDKSFPSVSRDQVSTFVAAAEKGKASEASVNNRTKMVTRESDQSLFMESVDTNDASAWVHRSYILK